MPIYRVIFSLITVSVFSSVLSTKIIYADERAPFYRDYLLQRMRIAKIREIQGDPTAKSLLQSLTTEADNIGMKTPKWAQPFHPQKTASSYTIRLNKPVKEVEALIFAASKKYGLPPALIKAVVHVESAFVKDAVSNKGAQGLMQLMPETSEDIHITRADLELATDADIKKLKKSKSYKGLRHQWGLPVRGQKTKSNFRKNKGKVTGVKKKAQKKSGK